MLFVSLFATVMTFVITVIHAQPHDLAKRGSSAQIDAFLYAHNVIRGTHNATSLTWSPEYAARAEVWADACEFTLTGGNLSAKPYGELHTAATGNFNIPTAIGEFVKDKDNYNPDKPTFSHFTQMVWKSTTQVGCARATCNNLLGRKTGEATYYVCFYDPAGNVIGKAAENVQL